MEIASRANLTIKDASLIKQLEDKYDGISMNEPVSEMTPANNPHFVLDVSA